jgi:hypothetical protein
MVEVRVELPDFKEFLEDLRDGETARDFLLHIMGIGYTIDELKSGVDIRTLTDECASDLAKRYWMTVFLTEYQDYGDVAH